MRGAGRALAAPRSGWRNVLLVPRQVVGDRKPRRFGADENMVRRPYGRIVDESSHGDVNEGPFADDRKEQRAADPAMGIVRVFFAEVHKLCLALCDYELPSLDSGEWLERQTVPRSKLPDRSYAT